MNLKFVLLENNKKGMIIMKKVAAFLIVFILIITIRINCYAKYIIDNSAIIANIKIDGKKPQIELVDVKNTNTSYQNYASKKHKITIKMKVTENNITQNNFDKDHIKILVGDKEQKPEKYKIVKQLETKESIIYAIAIENLTGDGKLKIKLLEKTIIDIGDQSNDENIIDTNIIIDNTPPVITFEQSVIEDGKICGKVKADEQIQEINAWKISEDKMQISKIFECNVTYPLRVYDYAYNSSEPLINITKATNIQIKYGAISEDKQWSFGNGNGDTAGKSSILNNPNNKVEAISLYAKGNIEKDFVQIQGYANTYWGEGTQGRCYTYETAYNSGYNPSQSSYYSLKNGNIINLNGDYALLIGGTAMNRKGNRGLSGGNPIPEDISKQHLFGISAIKMKLKDTRYYSIVYQIWINGSGWQEAKSDDEETTYAHNRPISGYRVSLIPKTEKQYLTDYWNKDKGSDNIK